MMTRSSLLIFAAAYFAALVTPGPGVTALVARVLARGTNGISAFIGGFATGALVWFTVAATGLAAIAINFSVALVIVRYLGAAYLIYLAWKLWRAPVRPLDVNPPKGEKRSTLFLAGLAINLGNPKLIVFFLALLPTVVDLAALNWIGFAELSVTIVMIVSSVLGAYAFAASRARRLFTSPRAIRVLNRGSAAVMAGAAASLAAR